MTKYCYFLPMPQIRKPHTIALLAYNGCDLLDVTGPAAVFATANRVSAHAAYEVLVVSRDGDSITSLAQVALQTRSLRQVPVAKVDTLLIAGGAPRALQAMIADPAVRRWVCRCAASSRRFGSTCTGAFALA